MEEHLSFQREAIAQRRLLRIKSVLSEKAQVDACAVILMRGGDRCRRSFLSLDFQVRPNVNYVQPRCISGFLIRALDACIMMGKSISRETPLGS